MSRVTTEALLCYSRCHRCDTMHTSALATNNKHTIENTVGTGVTEVTEGYLKGIKLCEGNQLRKLPSY